MFFAGSRYSLAKAMWRTKLSPSSMMLRGTILLRTPIFFECFVLFLKMVHTGNSNKF